MVKKILFYFSGALILSMLNTGCKDEETYPITPEITFVSLEKFTSVNNLDSLILVFSFTDGDGDLGSPQTDVSSRDIFVKLFEKQNGTFVEAVLAAPLEYRMPYLEPRGNNNSLKGDTRINIDYNILQPNDTIKYQIYIKDRARHSSNTIESSVIVTGIQ